MPQPLRILHYNIFNGFKAHEDRPGQFLDVVRDQNSDVLFINEYRPISGLVETLPGLGYTHSVINDEHESANQAALFSRLPFDRVLDTPAHARFAAAVIGDTHFVAYHTSPKGTAVAIPETQRVLSMLDDAERVVLCGDLNSLSRLDREPLGYDAQDQPGQLERYRVDGTLSYTAMDAFAAAGFTDHRGTGARHTVPTGRGRRNEGKAPLRIDYILSRGLSVTGVEVLQGEPFDTLSDHYPIRAEVLLP